MITIGSLFDGIGGFPFAAQRNGMKAIWASEIEPFPINVTKIRFPEMKHLGDITKINGAEIEPVDIITGGSPCQDLSVAGKRAGMKHTDKGDEETTRSGLFMEQIRIVREMREHEKRNGRTGVDIRPRFMVWENVPGAFSSNKGEDFRAVLEETARIADETAVIPGPPKGKWNTAGCIMGDSWSIAWRVLDAQYWGVPQRRRRIFLVADFGGQSAPEILFKRKGLSRHLAESGEERESIASDAERGVDETGECLTPWDVQSRRIHKASGKWPALYGGEGGGHGYVAIDLNGGSPACNQGGMAIVQTYQKVTGPLMANSHPGSYTGQDAHSDMLVSQRYSVRRLTPLECERLQGFPDGWTDIPGQTEATEQELEFWREVWLTWDKTQAEDPEKVKPRTDKAILKWLKNPVSDSAQYKGLGNSVAVPCPEYVMEGIKEVMEATNETYVRCKKIILGRSIKCN